jgi:hypothetical protein
MKFRPVNAARAASDRRQRYRVSQPTGTTAAAHRARTEPREADGFDGLKRCNILYPCGILYPTGPARISTDAHRHVNHAAHTRSPAEGSL